MSALRKPELPADEGYENKPASEGRRPEIKEGEPCRKCAAPVVKQPPRKKPQGDYYYEYYLWCPKCEATYQVEEAKRQIPQAGSLF
jgi:hypothetical protein